MPLSLARLNKKSAPATISFGDGDTLNVTFYPNKLTGEMVTDINSVNMEAIKAMTPEEQLRLITVPASYLIALLASWDLAEDVAEDGTPINPIPLDADHIKGLGLPILWAILVGLSNSSGDTSGKSGAPMPTVAANGSPNETPSDATLSLTAA